MGRATAVWIFGYGSLIWRAGFPWTERRPGYVRGFARRFWQGSPDHRGVPGAPGRVVTLIGEAGATTAGVAYRLAPDQADATLARLDHREQAGYERHLLEVRDLATDAPFAHALTFVAAPENDSWLGPAPAEQIAAHIRRSSGPSGPNLEYLLELDRALADLGAHDPHVASIVAAYSRSAQQRKPVE